MSTLDDDVERAIASHPALRFAKLFRNICLLGGIVALASGVVSHAIVWHGIVATYAIALGAWMGSAMPRNVRSAVLINMALENISRGRFEDAEALHARLPAKMRRSVMLALAIQRAWIAFDRGDAAASIEHATTAIAIRPGLRTRDVDRMARSAAYARRAIAHAALGHALDATRDADEVERAELAAPDVLALASLARALVLAKASDAVGLAAHLKRDGALLAEESRPRERALVRALRQMVHRRGSATPYREPAATTRPEDRSPLAEWLDAVAPGAAEFAPAAALHNGSMNEPPRIAAHVEPLSLRPRRNFVGTWWKRGLILWGVLILVFLGIWQVLQPSPQSHAGRGDDTAEQASNEDVDEGPAAGTATAPPSRASVAGVTIAICVSLLGVLRWRQAVNLRRLVRAQAAMARGNLEQAGATFAALVKNRNPVTAGAAYLGLARIAERRAEWAAVVAATDGGLERTLGSSTSRAGASDYLIPGLIVMRALALASSGKSEEADAARALLARAYPSYGLAASAHYRLALIAAVNARDWQRAVAVARTRTPALSLTIREDLLTDVVLATTGTLPEDELRRIDAELQDDAQTRHWIDAVAPDLRARVDAVAVA